MKLTPEILLYLLKKEEEKGNTPKRVHSFILFKY